MRMKHSGCLAMLLPLFLFTFACNSSPQKSEVRKNAAPAATSEAVEAAPLTTTVEVTGGTIEGVAQDGILTYKGIPLNRLNRLKGSVVSSK